jgi:hypothetical protein
MRLACLASLTVLLAAWDAPAATGILNATKSEQNMERGTAPYVYHYRLDAASKDNAGLKVYAAPFTAAGIRQLIFYDRAVRYQYVRVLSKSDIGAALESQCSKLKGCAPITAEQLKAELASGRAS